MPTVEALPQASRAISHPNWLRVSPVLAFRWSIRVRSFAPTRCIRGFETEDRRGMKRAPSGATPMLPAQRRPREHEIPGGDQRREVEGSA
jgi:hypothetical protein